MLLPCMASQMHFANQARIDEIDHRLRVETEVRRGNLDVVDVEGNLQATREVAKQVKELRPRSCRRVRTPGNGGILDQNAALQPVLHTADLRDEIPSV